MACRLNEYKKYTNKIRAIWGFVDRTHVAWFYESQGNAVAL